MIKISNLKSEKDLEIIAEEYSNYYNNSVLEEKWTKESAIKLFKYFYNQAPDLFFIAYDNENPVGVIMTCLKPWWDGMHLEDGEVFVCKKINKKELPKCYLKNYLNMLLKNMMQLH